MKNLIEIIKVILLFTLIMIFVVLITGTFFAPIIIALVIKSWLPLLLFSMSWIPTLALSIIFTILLEHLK